MKKSMLALILTIVAGLIGIYLGAAINLEGYLGIIFAIAVMGFSLFVQSRIKSKISVYQTD